MIYEFKCKQCGTVFDVTMHSCTLIADEGITSLIKCPDCGGPASRKFSAPAVVQRYNLDIRKGDSKNVYQS